MCLALFIASDAELPELPWSESAPAFAAVPLRERQSAVARRLRAASVRALWAHTGCGCGFSAQLEGDAAARRQSTAALAAYVAEAVREGPVELYVCWDDAGEYERPAERRLQVTAAELARRDDWLAERSHVDVVASG